MINLVRSNSRRSLALFILLTMFLSIVFYTKPLVGNVISKGILVWVPQNLSSARQIQRGLLLNVPLLASNKGKAFSHSI